MSKEAENDYGQSYSKSYGLTADVLDKMEKNFSLELMNQIFDFMESKVEKEKLYEGQAGRPTDINSFGNLLLDGIVLLRFINALLKEKGHPTADIVELPRTKINAFRLVENTTTFQNMSQKYFKMSSSDCCQYDDFSRNKKGVLDHLLLLKKRCEN
ncbi:MAG: Transgelin-3 [Paramarteilia canceri]